MSAETSVKTTRERAPRRWKAATIAGSMIFLVGSFASCAVAENDSKREEPGSTVPEAGPVEVPALPDAASPPDAGCEPGDPNCTTEVSACDDVAWCMHPTPLDPLRTFTAVWGTGPNDVWAIGSGGTIMHYDGKTWVQTPTGVFDTLSGIWGSGPNDIWVVSTTTTILHGTGFKNGTAAWTLSPTGFSPWNSAILRAVWGSSASDVRVGGRMFDLAEPDWDNDLWAGNQLLLTSGESDTAWKQVPGTATVRSIWGSSASDVWMAADNSTSNSIERGLLLHGTPREGGASEGQDPLVWTSIDSQSSLTFDAMWGSGPNDIWAVGALGSIRHYVPGNVRFDKVPSGTTVPLHAIWGSGPDDIWVVGDAGTILHYDGKAFTPATAQLPLGRKPNLYGVWGSSANDVWIVGDGVALRYTGPKSGNGGSK